VLLYGALIFSVGLFFLVAVGVRHPGPESVTPMLGMVPYFPLGWS
jgi:hypothetical protein